MAAGRFGGGKNKVTDTSDEKSKLLSDEVEQLDKKKRLQMDSDNLEASANEMAEKAETQHSVNCINTIEQFAATGSIETGQEYGS